MKMWSLLLAGGAALVISLGACGFDPSGLPPSSSDVSSGGAPSTSSSSGGASGATAAGGGQEAETSATAQSSAGAGGAGSSGTSSAASSASSSASSSSGGAGVTCDDQYGSASNYELCSSPAGFCEFNVKFASDKTCRAVCATLGGECAALFDNTLACRYIHNDKGCDSTGSLDAVCRCSLGCGGGPPCTASQACNNGVCTP